MSSFEYGVKRAVAEIIAGVVTSFVLIAFLKSGSLNAKIWLTSSQE
jgi:hypothetical protein